MLNLLPLISVFFLLSCSQPVEKKAEIKQTPKKVETISLQKLEEEYAVIDTIPYLEAYIERIIMVGSSGLGFASGKMQGGFADVSDAQKISHYVVTLAGRHCSNHEMAKKAQMYYTSNCGGCHGDDGKGQNGTFPDLTKPTMQGIENRKEYLKFEIEKLKRK